MADQWYCSIEGTVSGPVSEQQLRAMAEKGYLAPGDLVRVGADGPWIPAKRVKTLFEEPRAPAPPPSSRADAAGPQAPAKRSAGPAATTASSASRKTLTPPPAPPPPAAPPVAAAAPANAFSFLEEDGAAPARDYRGAAHAAQPADSPEDVRHPSAKRRKQLLLVWTLLATVISLAGILILVNVLRKPPQIPHEPDSVAAAQKEVLKARGAEPKAIRGDSDLKNLELPGGKAVVAAKAAKPSAQKDDGPWVDARESPAKIGETEIKVSEASVGQPSWLRVIRDGKLAGPSHFLVVALNLNNASEAKKVDFRGFSEADVELKDNLGNRYALKFSQSARKGPTAIYPGKALEDRLVFEPPVESAKLLRLSLSATPLDGKGKARFEIPQDMIGTLEEGSGDDARSASAAKAPPEKAQAKRTPDAGEEGPSGDPNKDFGIKAEDGEGLRMGDEPPAPQADKGSKPEKRKSKTKPTQSKALERTGGFKQVDRETSDF